MKAFSLFVIAIFALTAIPASEAYMLWNNQQGGYAQVQSWSPFSNSMNTYARTEYVRDNRYTRPSGYGLVPMFQNYPSRARTTYCENNDFIGHTSIFRPGRYYSGIDGTLRSAPQYRPQNNRCAPRSYPAPNRLRWGY